RLGSSSLYNDRCARDAWCISPDVSASRILSITAVLRALALFEGSSNPFFGYTRLPHTCSPPELSDNCNTVMAFYATSLSAAVGPSYQAPSLVFLAKRWFDASSKHPSPASRLHLYHGLILFWR